MNYRDYKILHRILSGFAYYYVDGQEDDGTFATLEDAQEAVDYRVDHEQFLNRYALAKRYMGQALRLAMETAQ